MGSVCSKKKSNSKSKSEETRESIGGQNNYPVPAAQTATGPDLPLTFKVTIDNIKVRNVPLSACYVKIIFAKNKEFVTQRDTLYSSNYNWKFKQDFEFETTRHALFKSFIELIIMDGYDRDVGNVAVNLHDIVTGPHDQDFAVNMSKGYKETPRLSFTVRMFQNIHMLIKTGEILCNMNEGLREKYYNFTLKMKTKDREFLSEHSIDHLNPNYTTLVIEKKEGESDEYEIGNTDENKQVRLSNLITNQNDLAKGRNTSQENMGTTSQIETVEASNIQALVQSKTLNKGSSGVGWGKREVGRKSITLPSSSKHPVNKEIKWTFTEADIIKGAAPTLEMDVNIKELINGSFQFLLWTSKQTTHAIEKDISKDSEESGNASEEVEVYIDHKLAGECFVGMNKFFFQQAEINFNEDKVKVPGMPTSPSAEPTSTTIKPTQTRIARFNEKLWNHGAGIGDFTGEFTLENSSFYRQMIVGLRTEEGIQKQSSMYLSKDSNTLTSLRAPEMKEVKTLDSYKDQFKTIIFNLANPKITPVNRNKAVLELREVLQKILDTLKTLTQDFNVSFTDKAQDAIITRQKSLIHVAKNLIESVDDMNQMARPLCLDNLILLINRGEFELGYMGFDENYIDALRNEAANKIDSKLLQRKIEVCQEYQALLYQILQRTMNRTNDKSMLEKERDFVNTFNASAFFKIPEYRQKFLEYISKEDKKISQTEWRGTDLFFEDRTEDKKKNIGYFISLFDWEKDFYSQIKKTEIGQKNDEILNKLLADNEWKEKISKKGSAFYNFLIDWINQVDRTIVIKDHIPWMDIPGYTALIKSFLIDLQAKDVRRYSKSLINASCVLLRNEKLINIFVSILYKKTNIFDSLNVFAVYELINKWLISLQLNNRPMPSTFDYGFFFKGLYMVLEGEHALNIAITLLVIYNNFNIFPYTEKGLIAEYMFNKNFFRLFLHWSWSVRQVFHHLLIYRLYHQHRDVNTDIKDLDDLRKEFLQYNQRREAQNQTKKLLINDFINMQYSRNMTIIENAYQKFNEEKKQKALEKRFKNKFKPLPKMRYASSIDLAAQFNPSDLQDGQRTLKSSAFQQNQNQTQTQTQNQNQNQNDNQNQNQNQPILGKQIGDASPKRHSIGFVSLDIIKNKPGSGLDDNDKEDSNFYLINPDKLESSNSDSSKQLTVRPTRSESYSGNAFRAAQNEGSVSATVNPNLEAIDPLDKDKGKYERINEKKKVIHRKFMYLDRESNEIKEIPNEYIVYLAKSYEEFEKTKEAYVKWLKQGMADPKRKNEQDKFVQKVPDLDVKIPLCDDEEVVVAED